MYRLTFGSRTCNAQYCYYDKDGIFWRKELDVEGAVLVKMPTHPDKIEYVPLYPKSHETKARLEVEGIEKEINNYNS